MAKQTFSTGQVLTAAQMTSLQQTAMLGGSAAVKTTSYVLVAADAGTSVAMNSTSATTVTVNTGLFAAGDTVTIINQNTGVCTVTAGTATVRKASGASLALSQYQGGVLDFISASEAIFFPFDTGSSASPLTTKGDLFTFSTTDTRLASSAVNNDVLTVDTSTATGLKWAAPSSGSLTQLATGSLSSTSLVVSGFSQSYTDLVLKIYGAYSSSNSTSAQFTVNSISSYNRLYAKMSSSQITGDNQATASPDIFNSATANEQYFEAQFMNYSSTSMRKQIWIVANIGTSTASTTSSFGYYFPNLSASTTITSITFQLTNGGVAQTLTAGTYILYGRK